jgi:hypothetical protein
VEEGLDTGRRGVFRGDGGQCRTVEGHGAEVEIQSPSTDFILLQHTYIHNLDRRGTAAILLHFRSTADHHLFSPLLDPFPDSLIEQRAEAGLAMLSVISHGIGVVGLVLRLLGAAATAIVLYVSLL